ncbi:MAG: hypothetical protein JW984_10525 [Deltaproteobacteria bacterium]|uniref:Uncharacterized protein n=1 Tax=Candidatus Zymogenus saltonus TaxID=2844893 RepID=A0A9D8PPQ3_9DELT|nr:hypothetical protein [Candidatus Zymogenus saltonus]
MTTEKQIMANRKNGLLGGVKTEEGKQISRLNAVKYGFFSKILIEADKLSNQDLCEDIYNVFKPNNAYEALLVEIILSNLLTYRRICIIESELTQKTLKSNPLEFSFGQKSFECKMERDFTAELLKFQRYKVSCFNMIIKTQHELERLRRINSGEEIPPPEVSDINILVSTSQ